MFINILIMMFAIVVSTHIHASEKPCLPFNGLTKETRKVLFGTGSRSTVFMDNPCNKVKMCVGGLAVLGALVLREGCIAQKRLLYTEEIIRLNLYPPRISRDGMRLRGYGGAGLRFMVSSSFLTLMAIPLVSMACEYNEICRCKRKRRGGLIR